MDSSHYLIKNILAMWKQPKYPLDSGYVVHTYNKILFLCKEKCSCEVCKWVDPTGKYYIKYGTQDLEKMPHVLCYVWTLALCL